MIDLLRVILRRGGYRPVPALGGRAALRLLRESGADLILLDLMMDDMSGWAVLDAIEEDDTLDKIPVLIISAKHHLEDAHTAAAYSSQYEGYLVKPFVVRDLLIKIDEALE
jgi:two-component system alkaline phosphatase synthesis response regulator PhoP